MLKPMIVQKLHEPSISEKLNSSPSMNAITPTQGPLSTMLANSSQAATGDSENKEANKPLGTLLNKPQEVYVFIETTLSRTLLYLFVFFLFLFLLFLYIFFY